MAKDYRAIQDRRQRMKAFLAQEADKARQAREAFWARNGVVAVRVPDEIAETTLPCYVECDIDGGRGVDRTGPPSGEAA